MDYARFLQILLQGGELEGVHLLPPRAVKRMVQNHIVDLPFPFSDRATASAMASASSRPGATTARPIGTYSGRHLRHALLGRSREEVGVLLRSSIPPIT